MNVSNETIYDIYYLQNKKKIDTCMLYLYIHVSRIEWTFVQYISFIYEIN